MLLTPEKNYSAEILKVFNQAWNDMVVVTKRDPKRLLNLRCSQLPFCPNEFFVEVSRSPNYSHLDMGGLYYTSVGTTVHEVMQTALPQFTKQIIGNWICKECGVVEHFQSFKYCCGFPMHYQEIDINYRGIQGHVDCLWKVSKNKYYIVDFKTCSIQNSASKKKDPGAAYKEQLFAYAWLLKKQYGLEIIGIMNLFLPRDNPKNAVSWAQPISKQNLKETFQRLKLYKQAHRTALNIKNKKDIVNMWDTFGRCSNTNCKVCTSHDPKQLLKLAVQSAKTLPLIEAINA